MTADNQTSETLRETAELLAEAHERHGQMHHNRSAAPLPSAPALKEIVALVRALVFPGYYGEQAVTKAGGRYRIGVGLERLYSLLSQEVMAGLCFNCEAKNAACNACECRKRAEETALELIKRLPEVRRVLATDVEAAYLGDPAAQTRGEVICCYPAIRALTCYRFAHELHRLGVPLIPRIITEMAHSETGIDIHPAAQIGHHFTIDHGTGVVIGATCIIGAHVKLYQGVTLGAKSFPLDESGNPVKNIARHPILEDGVIVYSNATILGRITVGRGAVIGANVWLTESVDAETQVKRK